MKGLVFLLLAFIIILVGCSNPNDQNEEAKTVTFTDALGRTVSVESGSPRTAALIGSFADIWLLAGGKLCAAAEDAREDFGIDMSGIINLGGAHSPSLESLVSAQPELVLASASSASNVKLRSTLEAMGITVAYFDVDCFEDYLEMLRICTGITGHPELYEENGLRLKDSINKIKASVSIPEDEQKILLLRASSSSLKAKGSRGTILGEMLSDLGCENIADGETSLLEDLSIESILTYDPYRIFIVPMGGDGNSASEAALDMMHGSAAWSTLSAVSNGRVHIMDKELFNLKPNDRWAIAYETLANVLCETD